MRSILDGERGEAGADQETDRQTERETERDRDRERARQRQTARQKQTETERICFFFFSFFVLLPARKNSSKHSGSSISTGFSGRPKLCILMCQSINNKEGKCLYGGRIPAS